MPSTREASRTYQLLLGMLCALLAVASLLYWSKGLIYLVVRSETPGDFSLRWVDERYIFAGRNPYDAFFATSLGAYGFRPLWNPRPTSPLPGIGAPRSAGYPPWAFFAGAIFFWPDLPAARFYFAIIDLLAGGLIFAWAYGLGRAHGKLAALTLALGCTACGANATTLENGQYGIIITALLVGSLWLIERRQRALSGVMLGLALTKPIIAGPFCLPLLFRREWKAIAGLAVYLLVADGVIWAVTHTNPIEMFLQMLHAGQAYMSNSYGPMTVLLHMGMSESNALAIAAVTVAGIGGVLMWLWRDAPMLVQFAIASFAGRLWTYHRIYDNIMVLFLLIALGEAAFRCRKPSHFIIFLLVGATLWAPDRACDQLPFQIFQMVMWIIGVAFILAVTPRKQMPNPQSDLQRHEKSYS